MKVLCTICARGGSKGVPNKNIRKLLGKSLIAYTIEHAFACKAIDKVAVSTDSLDIQNIARENGAEIPYLRPVELAKDTSAKLPVIQHMVKYYIKEMSFVPDYIVDLDPTSPLRKVEDIERCLDLIINDKQCDSVITGCRSDKNPYFNMVECDENGYAHLSHKLKEDTVRRQDAPLVYAMNASVYVWRTEVLLNLKKIISGRLKFVEMPRDRSVDIDSEVDFKLVELLMKERIENDISK